MGRTVTFRSRETRLCGTATFGPISRELGPGYTKNVATRQWLPRAGRAAPAPVQSTMVEAIAKCRASVERKGQRHRLSGARPRRPRWPRLAVRVCAGLGQRTRERRQLTPAPSWGRSATVPVGQKVLGREGACCGDHQGERARQYVFTMGVQGGDRRCIGEGKVLGVHTNNGSVWVAGRFLISNIRCEWVVGVAARDP